MSCLRVVRVLPDVAGLDKTFDYLVPDDLGDQVRVGTLVRISLHGRRVGAWVVADGVEPPPGVLLAPLAKVTGWGPSPELVDLARWAAHRWAGRRGALLRTASPPGAIRGLPTPIEHALLPAPIDTRAERAFERPLALLRLPPAGDPFLLVLAAARRGDALVVCPSVGLARSLAVRLRRAGATASVVPREWGSAAAGGVVLGARAAAWAPVRQLAAVVVLDEHDESLQEERTPTWHARDVAIERARRAGVPCLLVSPVPSLEALLAAPLLVETRAEERAGWPLVEVVDRRSEPPGSGLFSERLVHELRTDRRVVCVLNRTGRARLLACGRCGETARCETCGAAVGQDEPGRLRCRRCGTERPLVCLACGSTRLKNLRAGVSRVREELEALADRPVVEVSGAPSDDEPVAEAGVYVGTEAVLHRLPAGSGGVDVVAFLDLDQELLAPRYRAAEQAMAMLAKASRLLGPRAAGGRLLLQTRLPDHEVVQAAEHSDPRRVAEAERNRRQMLRFPPFAAMAEVSGAAAPAWVAGWQPVDGVELLGPTDGRWLVRAPDHDVLADALAQVHRPAGRLRIAVDPLRV